MLVVTSVALVITAMASLALGVAVLQRNPRAILNRLFLAFTINAALWVIAVFMVATTFEYEGLLYWVRISHVVASTIPCFVVALVYTFDEGKYPYAKVAALMTLGVILGVLSYTPHIIQDMSLPLEQKDLVYGPLFQVYPLFFGSVTLFSLFKLFRILRRSRGIVRFQARYFFGGILISFIVASLVNIFLPLVGVGHVATRNLGPIALIIGIASIGYAIGKYRLMDIHLILRRLLIHVLVFSVLATICILPFYIIQRLYGPLEVGLYYLYVLVTAFLVALLYQTLRNSLKTMVDRYFYRGAYDYFDALLNTNKAMLAIIHRDQLLQFVVNSVVETMYISRAIFYLRRNDGSFAPVNQKHLRLPVPDVTYERLAAGNQLISYLVTTGRVLLKTDLRDVYQGNAQPLVLELDRMQVEAAVPVTSQDELAGVLLLGAKQSGEPFSNEDVRLLSTLSVQLTGCLKNAQLYQEVLVIKRYLENILANMGNGLITIDGEGKIVTCNSAAATLTGLAVDRLLGEKVDEAIDHRLSSILLQALHDEQSRNEVEVEMSANGLTSFLSCSTAIVESPETGERGAIMVLSDITRTKELEQERSRVQRLASLGQIAAGMAHEIKNPLVSIKTFAELLPEKYEDPGFRINFSRIVSEEIERINSLVTELLSFTRTSRPYCEEVDAAALMDEVLLLLSPQLENQSIRVYRQYDPEVRPLWADKNQLKQAFFNVCLNGIQAMSGGGDLRVSILPESSGNQSDKGLATGGKVKIVVEDTGVGISAREKEKVFDPFFSTKPEGVGIGLSISHKIVVDHGGTIQIRSEQGEGAAFEICLPAAS